MSPSFDDAVVGAGILGLAHTYHLARAGRRVLVLERSPRAAGASVRNFGMLWPIGQPAGARHRLALRSLAIWRDVLRDAALWHDPVGSLHLAYHEDEAQVLREFVGEASAKGYDCTILSPRHVLEKSPAVRGESLLAGMWSPTETCVDPREVVDALPNWLAHKYGVHFEFGCPVAGYDRPYVKAGGREWAADHLWVCTGDDFHTLYPEAFESSGLFRCKLQMMRTTAYGHRWRLGPMLAAGLTLRHYLAFAHCPTLPALRARVAAEMPENDQFGIHLMASQNGHGEVVIGDSHEYGEAIQIFDKARIDELILAYLHTFLQIPELRIASRWHGTYAKHPTDPYWIARPAPGVTVVTGVGGNGMTLSFGLAEQVVSEMLRGI
jgi:FAD dependent oxidoreductase TIGR03364